MNPQHSQNKLIRVRPEEDFTTKRNLNYFPGAIGELQQAQPASP